MNKIIFSCAVLLLLSGCTSTNFQQYSKIDNNDKSITVPAGSKGLKGEIKKGLSDMGWRLSVTRGPSITETTKSRTEQFDTFNTRYTLFLNSNVYDYCFNFSPAITYDLSMIDNNTGSEVITMDGRGCEDSVTSQFINALSEHEEEQ